MGGDQKFSYKESGFSGLIGTSRVDITPPVGIFARSWGAAKTNVATGVHRALTLTCTTFQSSATDKPLILISADFCVWRGSEEGKKLRKELLKVLGIPESHLMFCLSHTHAGPVLSLDDSHREGGHLIGPYIDKLQKAAIKASRGALEKAAPAILTWKYGKCELATNRDLRDPESDRFLVGFNPSEPADDTLLVGRITDMYDNTIATIVNYACHPTTLAWENSLLSPDFVGAMRELIEKEAGGPCLFLQGASGELAPAEQYSGDTQLADKHGRQLGYAVLSVLAGMLSPGMGLHYVKALESGAPLAVWQKQQVEKSTFLAAETTVISYQLRDLPTLEEIIEQYEMSTDPIERERLWRKRAIRINLGEGSSCQTNVFVWKLGDSILIGQPNEAYSNVQVEIRKALNPACVAVINLVNGSAGYLPPAALYSENIYQVWQSPFAQGSMEILIEASINSAKKIDRQNNSSA